jgi:gamma-glutamylcyclotransferase (GGCT)/AIG2-like uncharacterized protein YtfP
MIYYFAYGMNTNLDQMTQRCPKAQLIGPAVLPGYRFRFAGCADIVEDDASHVDGVLWYITEDCLAALDVLEGYPAFYNSREVLVKCGQEDYFAEVYYMNPGVEDGPPSRGYYEMVLEGYQQNQVPVNQITAFLEPWQKNNNPLTLTLF